MASNVIPLFVEPEVSTPTELNQLLNMITDWAENQGVDIRSLKYKYDCATISTLLQLMVNK